MQRPCCLGKNRDGMELQTPGELSTKFPQKAEHSGCRLNTRHCKCQARTQSAVTAMHRTQGQLVAKKKAKKWCCSPTLFPKNKVSGLYMKPWSSLCSNRIPTLGYSLLFAAAILWTVLLPADNKSLLWVVRWRSCSEPRGTACSTTLLSSMPAQAASVNANASTLLSIISLQTLQPERGETVLQQTVHSSLRDLYWQVGKTHMISLLRSSLRIWLSLYNPHPSL